MTPETAITASGAPFWLIWTLAALALAAIGLCIMLIIKRRTLTANLAATRKQLDKALREVEAAKKESRKNFDLDHETRSRLAQLAAFKEDVSAAVARPFPDNITSVVDAVIANKCWPLADAEQSQHALFNAADNLRRGLHRARMLRLLDEKVVSPLRVSLRVSDSTKGSIDNLCGDFVRTALATIEAVGTMRPGEDSKVDALYDNLTEAQALQPPVEVTDISAMTPAWVRCFNNVLQNLNLPKGEYIFDGYKFNVKR